MLAAALLALSVGRADAVTVPAGFQDQLVAGGLEQPAVLAFAPDGRLFVGEKASGKVRIIAGGTLLPAAFVDVSAIVDPGTYFDSFNERGLLGIAFDPDFATNGFVYLYHTVCKQPVSGDCATGQTKNRIIRVRAVGDVAAGDPPFLVLDDVDSDAGNHNGGWIDFGPIDEKLYVSTGDGGEFHEKSQDRGSLSGKVLRLEADGSVPADNPYAGAPGARGEVWASGLRNPWRCRFRDDGRLLCADVGQDTWEEIDVVFEANDYGWPATQDGPFTLAEFPSFTPPIYAYAHAGSSAAIMGGDFGAKTSFPGDYQDSWFFGDYARGVIQRVVLDTTGTSVVSPALDFATGLGGNSVTDIVAGPNDGALYYTRIGDGEVRRIILVPGNHAPVAVAGATNASGPEPLTVAFSSAGSVDEDDDPLTFTWDFGDGSPAVEAASPSHQYETRGAYTAMLTVSDGKPAPGPGTATVAVVVGHPPVVTISQPLAGTTFDAGEQITLIGSAVDTEDGAIQASKLAWKVVFHHAEHTHPFIDHVTATPRRFTTASVGETSPDVQYEIVASVTDSDGITGSAAVFISPNTVPLAFETVPPGFDVTLDGEPHATPFEVTSVVGMQRSIGAPAQNGYGFGTWSDGGAQTHAITAPAGATTLIAVFAAPTATATRSPTPIATPTVTASPTPVGLLDPAAARAADGCQRAITAGTLAITRAVVGELGRCANAVQLCVQSRPGDGGCLAKATAACVAALDDVAAAAAKMQATMVRRCASTADVLTGLGLGFADIAADCTAHGDTADDVAGLAACIAKRSRCTAEHGFQLATPRAGELLRTVGVGIPAGSCLVDRGGSGTGAGIDAPAVKALTKCAAAITKSAGALLAGRTGAFGDCTAALFTCAQRKSLSATLPACLAKADAACARAADPTRAAAKLRRTIDDRCGETLVPYATLRAATAAYVDGVVAECAAEGVPDVASLPAFETCLLHQHECRAAELIRTAVPRTPELLGMVGRTWGPPDCPAAGGMQPQ